MNGTRMMNSPFNAPFNVVATPRRRPAPVPIPSAVFVEAVYSDGKPYEGVDAPSSTCGPAQPGKRRVYAVDGSL
jgi:hypothetical protein